MALLRHHFLDDGLTLDPLGRRLSGQDVAIKLPNSRTELVDRRILQTYLPVFQRMEIGLTYDGVIDLTPFLNKSWALKGGKVSRAVMLQTFRALLQSLSRNVGTSEATSIDLSEILEETFYEDRNIPSRHYTFPHTYQQFVCFAEIGARCHSTRINCVIHQFFIKFGREIATTESVAGLLGWTTTIIRSCMHEREIVSCLREIIISRPEFLNELSCIMAYNRSPRLMEVLYNLMQIANRIQGGQMDTSLARGQGVFQRGSFFKGRQVDYFPIGQRRRRARFAGYLTSTGRVRASTLYGNPTKRDVRQIRNDVRAVKQDLRQLRHQTAVTTAIHNGIAAGVLDNDPLDVHLSDGFETDDEFDNDEVMQYVIENSFNTLRGQD
jgi:hypothetical protein